ncbi:peptide/nickel transport system permease protein [Nocardioides daedukensis]|uniref:Peptide/nickel transport system permease protein n=1 Tax=Nocardioides daedukensis TaxID=634462 RepID=A0A7Y9S066_9ACTN|nr:ABC transporter permease [Nocardioides daedukensis]NYG59857.1 peptide/nickel transport system permease protein [Nocardioides daedukensis]
MLRYTGTRLLQGLIALFFIVTVVFFLARMTGDATALLAPPDATPEQLEAVRVDLGLDRPILVQYWDYLRGLVTGDLGMSTSYRIPVSDLVVPGMQATAKLALTAFIIALVLGVAAGALAAFRSNTPADYGVRFISVLGQSIPSFWLGMLLVAVFSVSLGWFPAFGDTTATSIVLPAISLAAFALASIARLTRSTVLEMLSKDQTLFERSKGVAPTTLVTHVLRNSSLPVVTLAGIQLGALFSGTIVIENLFAWPGVGQLAIQAINSKDFALIQGIVIVNTLVFISLLFVVDVLYGLLDPRVRRATGDGKSKKKADLEPAETLDVVESL